ncbi:MAG: preprotein translocase subunit SecE [Desulfovibrio sp.]|jgi:preprotein translocase subunit SecE|nr:preprotein translocase subunit SecE [Desulfovibrio sp.]
MAKNKDKAPEQGQTTGPPSHIKRFTQYVEASKAELRKVLWPTMVQTRNVTLVVLAFMAIMAILLSLVDLGLSSLIKVILS